MKITIILEDNINGVEIGERRDFANLDAKGIIDLSEQLMDEYINFIGNNEEYDKNRTMVEIKHYGNDYKKFTFIHDDGTKNFGFDDDKIFLISNSSFKELKNCDENNDPIYIGETSRFFLDIKQLSKFEMVLVNTILQTRYDNYSSVNDNFDYIKSIEINYRFNEQLQNIQLEYTIQSECFTFDEGDIHEIEHVEIKEFLLTLLQAQNSEYSYECSLACQ